MVTISYSVNGVYEYLTNEVGKRLIFESQTEAMRYLLHMKYTFEQALKFEYKPVKCKCGEIVELYKFKNEYRVRCFDRDCDFGQGYRNTPEEAIEAWEMINA